MMGLCKGQWKRRWSRGAGAPTTSVILSELNRIKHLLFTHVWLGPCGDESRFMLGFRDRERIQQILRASQAPLITILPLAASRDPGRIRPAVTRLRINSGWI